MKKLPKIPENADKLTKDASVEVRCAHFMPEFDMISFFNQNGYNVISSDDKRAADPTSFVYDKTTSTLSTPLMKPEEVLPLMQDLQQKFEQNKIGYSPFRAKYKDQFLAPESKNQAEVLRDEDVLKHLLRQNLERINVNQTWQDHLKENVSDGGPSKIYRGTAMGDASHTTISDGGRAFVYATPNILSAASYANNDTKSRFGFVEEYQASPNQFYSHDHGLESNQYHEDINWQNLSDASYKASETFVEKETNPHLKTYLYDRQTGMMFMIYKDGRYVDKFFEEYAKSRRPQKNYQNDNLSKRVQNIIESKGSSQEKKTQKESFFAKFSRWFSKDKKEVKPKVKNCEDVRQINALRCSSPTTSRARQTEIPQEFILNKSMRSK